MHSLAEHVAIATVALFAGMANAIAGGGTFLTFPALIGLGVPSLVANATSAVALWPGGLASMIGYRAELAGSRAFALRFALPSLLGGLTGAILLTLTSQRQFDLIVPFLVLFATLVFLLQRQILHAVRRHTGFRAGSAGDITANAPPRPFLAFHFLIAIYGGYFGAGAGIIMLAALGLMGLTNIHQMNGLKNFFATTFNLVAICTFAAKGLVDWPIAATMAGGAILGGWAAAGIAQRVPQNRVRGAVGLIGLASAGWLFVSRY